MSWKALITDAGNELSAKTISGGNIKLTHAKAGSGTVSEQDLHLQTELVNVKQTLSIESIKYSNAVNNIEILLDCRGLKEAYDLTQIGIYATDPDAGEILFAIAQTENPKHIPAENEVPFYSIDFNFAFALKNNQNMVATIDQSTFATKEQLSAVDARIDNIIVNAGSTEDNAELIDMRVDVDGKIHGTAGEALRSQLKQKANLTDISSPYQFRGACLSANLPGSGNKINDTYYVTDKKCKFTWNGAAWYQSSLNESDYEEELSALTKDLGNVTNNIYDVVKKVNLFNKASSGITNGYFLSPEQTQNDAYCISDYISIRNNKTYAWYSDANPILCLYDSSKKYLGYIRGTALTRAEIVRGTINNVEAVYGRFSYKSATKDKIMFVESETYPSIYVEYIPTDIYKLKGNIIQNPLYNKKVGVAGDSIMYGEGFTGGPISIIAKRNNMTMCNKAISGSKITINGSKETIYNQISKLDSDCDYILFNGGVNDMLLNNLGEVTKGFNSSYSEDTFCGSFEKLVHDLILLYPTKKLGYISVHRLKQWGGDAYSSYENTGYYNKTIEILEKWGIPICDLTKNCISLYENSELKKLYTKDGDGWHPNELGYEIYYVDKIESWMKML